MNNLPQSPLIDNSYQIDLHLHRLFIDGELIAAQVSELADRGRWDRHTRAFIGAQLDAINIAMDALKIQYQALTGREWVRRLPAGAVYDEMDAALTEVYEEEADESLFAADFADFVKQHEAQEVA